jgi:plasmid stabilization system protein ParE
MQLKWTSKSLSELMRLHPYLAKRCERAAAHAVQALAAGTIRLVEQPQIGERLQDFSPCDVRRILVGRFEMGYQISEAVIYVVLCLLHARGRR